jgi:hypothetical protein
MKLVCVAACILAVSSPATAQPLSREDLLAALKQRDEVISDLTKRVEALERERAAARGTAPPPAVAPAPAPPAAPPVAAPPAQGGAKLQDEAALEALSRTLVQKGGLVLRPWSVEVAPSVAYSHSQLQGLALVDTPEGIPTVADQQLHNDGVRAVAVGRLGLPWDSQVELQVPYVWERQSRALGNGQHAVNTGSGLGDVSVQLSHQLLHEKDWRPDLVGAIAWRFDTGRDPFRIAVPSVATGAGTSQLAVRFTAVKSTDPIVFYSTIAYAHDWPVDESFGKVSLGDTYRLDLGGILSVNPATSLVFGLTQDFRGKTQVDGTSLPGSDTVASTLQLGVDRVLFRNVLVDISLGVGLTRDAPDYVFQITTPIRLR